MQKADKNKHDEFFALQGSYLNKIFIDTLGTNLEKEIETNHLGGYVNQLHYLADILTDYACIYARRANKTIEDCDRYLRRAHNLCCGIPEALDPKFKIATTHAFFWQHRIAPIEAIIQKDIPEADLAEIAHLVNQYLWLPFRCPAVEWLLVDALMLISIRDVMEGASTQVATKKGHIFKLQKRKASTETIDLMVRAYLEITLKDVFSVDPKYTTFSPTHIRRLVDQAFDAGAYWHPQLYVLLDDMAQSASLRNTGNEG